MRSLLILSIAALCLSACHQPNGTPPLSASDTLHYTITHLKKTTGPCRTPDDLCATAEFSYPVFTGTDAALVNQWVSRKMGEGYMDTLIHTDINEVMQQFLSSYDTLLQTMPDYNIPWEFQKDMSVSLQVPGYVSIQVSTYDFAGGAHPNTMSQYYHYDLRHKKEISLSEVIKSGAADSLSLLAERIFRREFKLSDDQSMDSAGFFFENDHFYLPKNFSFTPKGIEFHYNEEIRSHAEGPYDLLVPYTDIIHLAQPDGYLHQVAEHI